MVCGMLKYLFADGHYLLRVKENVPVLHASFMDRLECRGLDALSAIGLFIIDKSGMLHLATHTIDFVNH